MKKILIILIISTLVFSSFAQSDSKVTALLTYEINKKEILLPLLLNFFLGFGIGSFVQGDIGGGFSVLVFDAIGTSLLISGAVFLNPTIAPKGVSMLTGSILAIIGGATLFITRIAELIIPFTYASSYNAKLQRSLGIAFGGFEPNFEVNANLATAVGFNITFKKTY